MREIEASTGWVVSRRHHVSRAFLGGDVRTVLLLAQVGLVVWNLRVGAPATGAPVGRRTRR